MADDDRLSERERDELNYAAVLDAGRGETTELTATVERIVAERVREAERRGAVEALREAADDLALRTDPSIADLDLIYGNWLRSRAYRLDRDGGT